LTGLVIIRVSLRLLEPVVSAANDRNAGRLTRRKGDPSLATHGLARLKKKARQQRRTIVFIDEAD